MFGSFIPRFGINARWRIRRQRRQADEMSAIFDQHILIRPLRGEQDIPNGRPHSSARSSTLIFKSALSLYDYPTLYQITRRFSMRNISMVPLFSK